MKINPKPQDSRANGFKVSLPGNTRLMIWSNLAECEFKGMKIPLWLDELYFTALIYGDEIPTPEVRLSEQALLEYWRFIKRLRKRSLDRFGEEHTWTLFRNEQENLEEDLDFHGIRRLKAKFCAKPAPSKLAYRV